jgi:hypothetical protein
MSAACSVDRDKCSGVGKHLVALYNAVCMSEHGFGL